MNFIYDIKAPLIDSLASIVSSIKSKNYNQAINELTLIENILSSVNELNLKDVIKEIKKTVHYSTAKKSDDTDNLIVEVVDIVRRTMDYYSTHNEFQSYLYANEVYQLKKERNSNNNKLGFFGVSQECIYSLSGHISKLDGSAKFDGSLLKIKNKLESTYQNLNGDNNKNSEAIKEAYSLFKLAMFSSKDVNSKIYYFLLQKLMQSYASSKASSEVYLIIISRAINALEKTSNNETITLKEINYVVFSLLFYDETPKDLLDILEESNEIERFNIAKKLVSRGGAKAVSNRHKIVEEITTEFNALSLIANKKNIDLFKSRIRKISKILIDNGFIEEASKIEKAINIESNEKMSDELLRVINHFTTTDNVSINIGRNIVNKETIVQISNQINNEIRNVLYSLKRNTVQFTDSYLTLERIEKFFIGIEFTMPIKHIIRIKNALKYLNLDEYIEKKEAAILLVSFEVYIQSIFSGSSINYEKISNIKNIEEKIKDRNTVNTINDNTNIEDIGDKVEPIILNEEDNTHKIIEKALNYCDFLSGITGNNKEIIDIRTQFEGFLLNSDDCEININEIRHLTEKLNSLEVEVKSEGSDTDNYNDKLLKIARKELINRCGIILEELDRCQLGDLSRSAFHTIKGTFRNLQKNGLDEGPQIIELFLDKNKEIKLSPSQVISMTQYVKSLSMGLDIDERLIKEQFDEVKEIFKGQEKYTDNEIKDGIKNNEEIDLQGYLTESETLISLVNKSFRNINKNKDKSISDISRSVHTLKGSANLVKLTDVGRFLHVFEDYLEGIKLRLINIDDGSINVIKTAITALNAIQSQLYENMSCNINISELDKITNKLDDCDFDIIFSTIIDTQARPIRKISPKEISDIQDILEKSRKIKQIRKLKDDSTINLKVEDARKIINITRGTNLHAIKGITDTVQSHADSNKLAANNISEYLVELRRSIKNGLENSEGNKSAVDLASYSNIDDIINRIEQEAGNVDSYSDSIKESSSSILRLNKKNDDNVNHIRTTVFNAAQVKAKTALNSLKNIALDTSKKLQKNIEVKIIGTEVLVDKTIITELIPVASHIIRNSVDHGLGKSGIITISINVDSGYLTLSISDNGKGMDPEFIVRKAIDKGIVSRAPKTEKECLDLIFEEGFSTAKNVTDISGRGVGLNVVKDYIDGKGGNILIDSKQGIGTTFNIQIPVSSESTKVFVCECDGRKYGIRKDQIKGHLVSSANDVVLEFQNEKYTCIPLIEVLGVNSNTINKSHESQYLLVSSDTGKFALSVDDSFGFSEIYLKPLHGHVTGIIGVSNFSDKEVLVCIDINTIIKKHLLHDGISYKINERFRKTPTIRRTRKALVVDDAAIMRKQIGTVLNNENYEVIYGTDGIDALRILEKEYRSIRLITLDIEMPNLDGISLLKKLKTDIRFQSIPVIMISSRSSEKFIKKCKDSGASEFLNKPFNQTALQGLALRYSISN